jgi:apolipoprotein N-acyltransferase
MTTLFIDGGIFGIFFLLFGLLFPILALIDILKSKFEGNTKLIWVILVVFTNIIGAILYYLIGKNQKIKE